MTEIKIIKHTTPKHLTETYNKISDFIDEPITLLIPSDLAQYRFGLLADILKLIITLNSKCDIKIVKLDFDSSELDKFYEQEYSYPLVALLWNTTVFVDKEGKNIKSLLRDKQNEFFKKMNSFEKFKGNKHIWVNTDHLSKSKGLIRLLENSNGFNDDEEKITYTIKKILTKNILTFNKQNLTEVEDILEDIGAIIYELTKNTFEWGRTDANFVEIPSSVRGAYLRFHINKKEKITEEYIGTPIAAFFDHKSIETESLNHLKQVYYLEILVFDSGVGFIDKFHQKDETDDLSIIKKCLIKNQTSSTSNLKSKKGIGLDRILKILDKKGFLKISTDRYSVYRDLIKDKYEPVKNNNLKDLVLEDWNQDGFKNQIKAQGSYISILYPFKN
tara:strand:+ start:1990 stop:3153 length:1164 start_codon:yes stop_codon:yes gene_type:complete